jgi:hypothetical protein
MAISRCSAPVRLREISALLEGRLSLHPCDLVRHTEAVPK